MAKDEEQYLFHMFQKNYEFMPSGIVQFDDKPDVIVTIPSGETIGVELTECIYDEMLMGKSEFQVSFNEKVVTQLEHFMPFKFMLDIELDSTKPLRQNQMEGTINGIIDVCISEFKNLRCYESKQVEQLEVNWNEAASAVQEYFLNQGYRKLPRGVSRIHMTRFDDLTKSQHPASKGGVVPDFTEEHLSRILIKKEKALRSYQSCTQQWLVIGEGGDFYSSMNRIEIKKGIRTEFDRVFMFRRWNSEVIVFK